MSVTLEDFAQQYDVKIRKDEFGDAVIFGRAWKKQPIPRFVHHRPASDYHYGHQIYEYGAGQFGLMLMFETPAKWSNAEKKLQDAGFTIKTSGISKGVPPNYDRYGEGIALFDPANEKQARLALKLAGVRFRRHLNLTSEQRQAIADRFGKQPLKRLESSSMTRKAI